MPGAGRATERGDIAGPSHRGNFFLDTVRGMMLRVEDAVVAVVVLVSTLVSTGCPPRPKIESTAAKW
jgi:hypothetical protein